MDRIAIGGDGLAVPRLIFGTASLFGAGSGRHRLALLESAVDHGFSHFDTAPYYGFGMAERDLAAILRRHPAVTVTSKVGLYAPGGEAQPALSILLRKAAGRWFGSLSRPAVDFSLARARRSLEGSLRRLGRAHIDLYLLHEPDIALVGTDEWSRWLEDRRRDGTIGGYGLAGRPERLMPFIEPASPLAAILQSSAGTALLPADRLGISYGHIHEARARGVTAPAVEILRSAMRARPGQAIIVATRRPERIAPLAELAKASR